MSECEPLPVPLTQRLSEFCAAGKTGNLQVDIKEGRIISGKLTESIRLIDKGKLPSK